MFGRALRGYRRRILRSCESVTVRGRSRRVVLSDGSYTCSELVVHQHEPAGWEAAMLDHFSRRS